MFRRLKAIGRRKTGRPAPVDLDQDTKSNAPNPELIAIRRSQAVIEFKLDGTITGANENFLKVMGYSLDEVVGRHHRMFIDPAEAASPAYTAFWQRLAAGEYFVAEFRRFGKNRKEVWIQGSYNPILDADGNTVKVIKFANDITASKLKNADANGQLAAIGNTQAVITFSLDGTITGANENFLKVMGYSLDEVVGRHHRMFIDPAEADGPAYTAFWQRLGAGEYFVAEFRRFGKNRKEVWIQGSYNPILDADGNTVKVIKFANDITASKLKNADANGQLAAIGNTQAVITFSLDGTITGTNRLFCETMGYTEDEIIGKHHSMFVQRSERASIKYRDFWRALGQGTCQTGEFCRIDRNGRSVWLQASYTPIFDPAGRPFKVVKYASDITAAKLRSLQFDAKLTAIGASTAVAEWSIDGRCLELNRFFVGRPLIGLLSLISQDDIASITHGKQMRREIAWPATDGDPVWLDATFSLVLDLEGRADRILMCAVDVTPRRRAIRLSSNAMQDMLKCMTAVVGNLNKIATTTNMLALNAAVQAGRAGEAGRGFAAVAAEVRLLAGQSEKAVGEMNDLIATGEAQIRLLGENATSDTKAMPALRRTR